ncbi:MAG: hypothetical protein ABSG44_16140 [Thermodesulfobacteriota bacterium]|jgi:hypothetical protein
MITVYLDHNVVDGFDKGETAYLDPLLASRGVLPIISLASVDEIFRGNDEARSRRNIESLKRLGIRYIHSGPDESHMSISELDYENMHQKWLKMQSDIGPLNDSHFLFISTLFRGNMPEAIQDMDQAISDQVAWIQSNYDKFPSSQTQMNKVLSDPQEYKELYRQLLHLKTLLPFTPKEINNIPEKSVFWTCVGKLKSTTDPNLQLIGNFIENEIESAKTIDDQFTIVLLWLNLFGYYPDDLTRKDRVRSNFSDANHATYAIACDGILTLDKKFAKRAAAAMGALKLETEVNTDANELLHRIAEKSGSR